MNKIILGILLMGVLLLSSCGNDSNVENAADVEKSGEDGAAAEVPEASELSEDYLSSKGTNGISSMNCALLSDEEVTRLCGVTGGGKVQHHASSSRDGTCAYEYFQRPGVMGLSILLVHSVDNFGNLEYEASKNKKTPEALDLGLGVEAKWVKGVSPSGLTNTEKTMIVFKRIIDGKDWNQHFLIQGETLIGNRPESPGFNFLCVEGGLKELVKLAAKRPLAPEAYS